AAYRDLKDRDLAREGARFIAESAMGVRRLLASPFPVESLLVTPRRAAEMSGLTGDDVPVYIITPEMMRAIVGFRLQSGVVACARRLPGMTLEEAMAEAPEQLTLMILPET